MTGEVWAWIILAVLATPFALYGAAKLITFGVLRARQQYHERNGNTPNQENEDGHDEE